MPHLMHNEDLKRLFVGSALAVVAGLGVGFSVKPSLAENLVAPQQEMGVSAPRADAAAVDAGVAAYRGQVPDYVVGTRWLQAQAPAAPEVQVLAYEDRAQPMAQETAASAADYAASAEATHVTTHWQDEARPPPRYPSERGGDWAESDLPEPPADAPELYDPA